MNPHDEDERPSRGPRPTPVLDGFLTVLLGLAIIVSTAVHFMVNTVEAGSLTTLTTNITSKIKEVYHGKSTYAACSDTGPCADGLVRKR